VETTTARRRQLVVCVHDVAPPFRRELREIVARLADLVGRTLCLAVVPAWQGRWPLTRDRGFCDWAQAAADELLLHGYTHRTSHPRRIASWVVGGADEFATLAADVAHERVARGQAIAREVFGAEMPGFVPPAWRMGALARARLATSGVAYTVELARLTTGLGTRARLATWSWDVGPIPGLGRMGEWIGRLSALRPDAIPCVVLHPADLRRGHLPLALAHLRTLLAGGREPVLFRDVVATLGRPA
jgi:predicted deacetylase